MAEINNTETGQWSEVDSANISPAPDGWLSGTFPSSVEPIGRATMGALKRAWDRINGTVTTTGSSGAYLYTPANTSYPKALVNGEEYSWKAHQDSAGGDTLNLNSLGAKPLYKISPAGPTAILAGDIKASGRLISQYDSALNSGNGAHLILAGLTQSSTGSVNTGAINQIAFYAGNGNTISGTAAVPNGVTATTQAVGDNSTKVATTNYTDRAVATQTSPTINGATVNSPNITTPTINQGTIRQPNIVGVTTNSGAVAGSLGEELEAVSASPVSLTNNAPTDVVSISLSAGDYDVYALIGVSPDAGTTISAFRGWVALASVTDPGPPNGGCYTQFSSQAINGLGNNFVVPAGRLRLSLAGTTTVFVSITAGFNGGTCEGTGFIAARRVR